jgi:hypothetical protein
MRLADRLGVGADEASQTYYTCLLFYVGCTAGAATAVELFGGEDALTAHAAPGRFGSRAESMAGIMRALEQGAPKHERRNAQDVPALYFAGLTFLYAASSSMVHGVGRDAQRVVASIASRAEVSRRRPARPSSARLGGEVSMLPQTER